VLVQFADVVEYNHIGHLGSHAIESYIRTGV
jgi:hypothetical protein